MTAESKPKKRIMVSLTADQAKMLETVCRETGLSKSAIVALAISDWMARRER